MSRAVASPLTGPLRALAFCALIGGCELVIGCGGASIDVTLRVPPGDHPLADADAVTLTLRAADGQLLAASRAGASAASARLPPVPAGRGDQLEIDALRGADLLARGRSCAFDAAAGATTHVTVWFSRVGRFAAVPGPAVPRAGGVAFAWDGGAVVAGGRNGDTVLGSSARYRPGESGFSDDDSDSPMLATPRVGARAVDLGIGTVLIVGGAAAGAPALEAWTSDRVTALPAGLPPELVEHAAAATPDGEAIIAGGRAGGVPTADAWRATDAGTTIEPLSPMAHARAGLTLTAAGGGRLAPIYAIGGVDGAGPVAAIEAFDATTLRFSDTGLSLAVPRAAHTTTRLSSGLLLVAGGFAASGVATTAADLVDAAGHSVRSLPPMRTARAGHGALLLPSGQVLLAGGIGADGAALADAELFDPAVGEEGSFVATDALDAPRAECALIPLCDGTVLAVGSGVAAAVYNPY